MIKPTNIRLQCTTFEEGDGPNKAGWSLSMIDEYGEECGMYFTARQGVMMAATILACSRLAGQSRTEAWVQAVIHTVDEEAMIEGDLGVEFHVGGKRND